MKIKLIIIVGIITALAINVYSEDEVSTNQVDQKNSRTGVWVDEYGFITYENGLKNGPCLSYKTEKDTITLKSLNFYQDNELKDPLLIFHKNGALAGMYIEIKENQEELYNGDSTVENGYFYQGYRYGFDENGILISEGYCLFSDYDDYFLPVGIWKFYKRDGTIEKFEYKTPSSE